MGLNWSGPAALWGSGIKAAFQCLLQRPVFEAFDCMGWIGKVSCIPGLLALKVFDELRNLSVPGICG